MTALKLFVTPETAERASEVGMRSGMQAFKSLRPRRMLSMPQNQRRGGLFHVQFRGDEQNFRGDEHPPISVAPLAQDLSDVEKAAHIAAASSRESALIAAKSSDKNALIAAMSSDKNALIAAKSSRNRTLALILIGLLGFAGIVFLAKEIGRGSTAAESIATFLSGKVVNGTHHPAPLQQWIKAAAAAVVAHIMTGIGSPIDILRATVNGISFGLTFFLWR